MSGEVTPDTVKLVQDAGLTWTQHALACTTGDYTTVIPSEEGRGEGAAILRKGQPLLVVTDKETDLLDESGQRIIFGLTRANSQRVSMISYEGYDQAQGAFVKNIDIGADGTLDSRTTEIGGRDVKREFRSRRALAGWSWCSAMAQTT